MTSSARQRLRARLGREAFNPGWLGVLVNPFYFARRGLRIHIAALGDRLGGRLLDVGCGYRPYTELVPASEYVGLEYDSPTNRARHTADRYYDGSHFPFADGEFDSVLCTEVFEHVFNPDGFLSEIQRVLRPDGMLLLTVPFVWDEHEQPQDYARYTSFGLMHLLRGHGFVVVEYRKSMNDVRVLFQMANAYVFKKVQHKGRWIRFLAKAGLIAPINLLGQVAGVVLPGNADLYLDSIVLARRA